MTDMTESEINEMGEVPAQGDVELLQKQLEAATEALQAKQEEIDSLTDKLSTLSVEKFGVQRFGTDNQCFKHYTGFPNYKYFYSFFSFVESTAKRTANPYYTPSGKLTCAGRPSSMQLIDELFMFMCRLRAGLFEFDLSIRFDISVSSVSRKLIKWANLLYFILGSIPIWLSKNQINMLMPRCFRNEYINTRVIIDCTEIRTQSPSSLVLKSQMYSTYKSANTLKALVGIAPHGAVTFVSSLYTGSISDVAITKLSGILDLLEPGDDVMADKGFTIQKVLAERRVTLNIPPFLSSKGQFTIPEVQETEKIAKLRVHVERAIKRVREDHFWDKPVPLSLMGTINQIWTVSCILSNFRGPLLVEKSTNV